MQHERAGSIESPRPASSRVERSVLNKYFPDESSLARFELQKGPFPP